MNVGTPYIAALIAAEQLRLAIADTLTKAALLAVNQQRFDEGRLLLTTIDTLNSIALNKQIQENELADAHIKAVMNGYLPSLTLKGYYGSSYFDNNFEILKSSNWNGNSFVNLGLRLPITGGIQRQKSISQLRLQQQASQLRYVSKRNKNSVDHAAATREAAVFKRNYLRTRENLVLAESNLRIAEQQFAAGRLNFILFVPFLF